MSQPYIGEIRIFAGNFAPSGWAICDGSLLPISEYETLFNLIGTTYGGDGQMSFALPDMRSRVPVHMGQLPGGQNYVLGQPDGVEVVQLFTTQIPSHTHAAQVSNAAGDTFVPDGGIWSRSGAGDRQYSSNANNPVAFHGLTVGAAGGSQPHDNMHPFLAINFIISLYGVFPSQT